MDGSCLAQVLYGTFSSINAGNLILSLYGGVIGSRARGGNGIWFTDGRRYVSGLEISTSGSARDQGFVTGLRYTVYDIPTETWTFPEGSTA